jgi:hypothetical protein
MNRYSKCLLGWGVCGLLACGAASAAGLEWKSRTIEVAGMKSDKVLHGKFEYVNRGDRPIRIQSAKTTCGCTVAKPSREVVGPGEGGEVEVSYKVASKVGYYEAIITVSTDDPSERETKLAMRLRVRDEVEMSRKLVVWREGEAADAKVVSFVPGDGKPIERIDAAPSSDAVTVRSERNGEGFDLAVSPAGGASKKRGVVTVTPFRDGQPLRPLRLHYRVF